jgi:hypothetical protein
MSVTTPITQLLGIKHPILLAGMGQTSGAPLAAAVSNAGMKDPRYDHFSIESSIQAAWVSLVVWGTRRLCCGR